MKHFQGVIDKRHILFISMILLPELIFLLYQEVFLGALIVLLLYVLLIRIITQISYLVSEDELSVKTSFLYRQSYQISNIKSITKNGSSNHRFFSSLKLIQLNCGKEGHIDVAPKDSEGFISHLLELKPDIELKIK